MTADFLGHIVAYGEATGCSCSMDEQDNHADIDVAGITVHLAEMQEAGFFVAQTGVAVLPPKGPAREAFLMNVLKANNLFSGTRGYTLGVDEEQDLVTLQLYWPTANLSDEAFGNILNNLMDTAVECIDFYSRWTYEAEESISSDTSSGMIRC